jgi:hypothetical protein
VCDLCTPAKVSGGDFSRRFVRLAAEMAALQ